MPVMDANAPLPEIAARWPKMKILLTGGSSTHDA
jgi:hypothetical protein